MRLLEDGEIIPICTVRAAFDTLREVAEASGPGSSERKVALLRRLFQQAGGLNARYVARFAIGRLRLGIVDATMMDALSVAASGGTGLRPRIEHAYALSSDWLEGSETRRIILGTKAQELVGKSGRMH